MFHQDMSLVEFYINTFERLNYRSALIMFRRAISDESPLSLAEKEHIREIFIERFAWDWARPPIITR